VARFTYYSDLRSIQLGEDNRSWIQAMRVGEYLHPRYGKLTFTLDRLKRFHENHQKRIRGIDLDIDYDHKADPAKGNEAAGWVQDSKLEGNALWLLVEWTNEAASKIKDKVYRYFSPEFEDAWTDASGVKHQDVLFGGGITNRPFLKDLLPVNLSELTFNEDKENGMDPKKVREMLGLPEDATDEQVETRAGELRKAETSRGTPTQETPNAGPDNSATNGHGNRDASAGATGGNTTENPFDEKQLTEMLAKHPMFAQLNKQLTEQNETIKKLAEESKRNGVRVQLAEVDNGAMKLTPAAKQLAEEAILSGDASKIVDLLKLVGSGNAAVQLGETQVFRATLADEVGKNATDIAEARAKKKLSEDKDLDYATALTEVFAEDTALFNAYQSDAYAFKI